MHRRSATVRTDTMCEPGDDEALYAIGWTLGSLASLGTIIAVRMFGM